MTGQPSALSRAAAALGALLAVAVVSRVAWELLRPVVPILIVLLGMCVFYSRVLRR